VFAAIGKHLEKNPELVQKVQTIFAFKLGQPDSQWTVDLKAGKVSQGIGAADCTLELSDADFMGMCTGKLDAQKLYFGGKLKISGNVMASQKLQFLQKMDPQLVIDAMKARGAVGGGAAAPTPATSGSTPGGAEGGPSSRDVFIAIADHVERNPELAAKVQTIFQFKLTEPASSWALDLKNGKGSLSESTHDKPDVTLELSDADFFAMASGQADPQKLYFSGKLKISGNVMASQKLSFLKKIDPEHAKAAVLKARGGGTAAAAAGGAPAAAGGGGGGGGASKGSQAAAIFDKLGQRLQKEPGLAKEVDGTVAFKVRGPDTDWVVSMKGTPKVERGSDTKADATLTLADEDLVALAQGAATAQHLFQQGKLRVDGDVRFAQRLGFLKGLA
jgi:3-hydroxyacyl-CoA dehydrogenase/3a,7a,12a-trihydroxy-5b-cholest-24-enoyl-CoA hydratase